MKKVLTILGMVCTTVVAIENVAARPNVGGSKNRVEDKDTRHLNVLRTAANCRPAEANIDIDINNVRARMNNAGDMWWDLNSNPRYEIPKGSGKHSLFTGSAWVAGIDAEGQLKVCAQTYRQDGNDYWPGPINTITQDVDQATCLAWDKIWRVTATDIAQFRQLIASGNTASIANNAAYQNIREWPAKGNTEAKGRGQVDLTPYMEAGIDYAPFVDVDGDGVYDWTMGDYPDIRGDQYSWWVFNDKGNVKQNTGSEAIGMEIQTYSFAFATRDYVNDMTFTNYRLINRGALTLNDCWMSTWTDADLGFPTDDYVGCDTAEGLGIMYNDAASDGNGEVNSYGNQVPMVGVDYFIGPRKDTVINGRDSFILLQMRAFTYFNNTPSGPLRNPSNRNEYYNYMTGKNANGELFSYDYKGPGVPSTGTGQGAQVPFIFWGDPSDANGWSECACNNPAGDRRFIHSAGPFVLKPGAANDMTIGAVWVADVGGCKDGKANFSKIKRADRIAQVLFESDFKMIQGPQAPRLAIRELDRKFIFTLINDSTSNNYKEQYGYNLSDSQFYEPIVKARGISDDTLYRFQGYRVFQLKSASVSVADIFDERGEVNNQVAREIFQCDIKDTIREIRNWVLDGQDERGNPLYRSVQKVNGANEGIVHSFEVDRDYFANSDDGRLVNYRNYYYVAIAYAYNNYLPFTVENADEAQMDLYLESTKGAGGFPLQVYKPMPNPANSAMGSVINSDYGTGVRIKRIEGTGNGGNELQLTPEAEAAALASPNSWNEFPEYEAGYGPVNIKVVDPVKVPAGNWEIYITGPSNTGSISNRGLKSDSTTWYLVKDNDPSTIIYADRNIALANEQILEQYGLAITVRQGIQPGDEQNNGNGYITSSISFADATYPWLAGVTDADGNSPYNWIRSGNFAGSNDVPCNYSDNNFDTFQVYEKTIPNFTPAASSWAPASLVAMVAPSDTNNCEIALLPNFTQLPLNRNITSVAIGRNLPSVDVIFTSDRSKWSKCVVVEASMYRSLAEGNAQSFKLRKHASWTGETDANGAPIYDNTDSGMSYFPGYAINQETGERLNIFFAENSWDDFNNGRDMLWNPTSVDQDPMNGEFPFGGKHFIYVSTTKYDECAALKTALHESSTTSEMNRHYQAVGWIGFPLLNAGYNLASPANGFIPNETRIRLRVERPYLKFVTPSQDVASLKNEGNPLYSFSTNGLQMSKLTDDSNPYYSDKKALLDKIKVVPNPYYAYTGYEINRLDTRVRIINLPKRANIRIYSLDGTLIKELKKDSEAQSYIEWDIRNAKGLPIASGMYLVHVVADGIGETVVKWFGTMRPVDVTTY